MVDVVYADDVPEVIVRVPLVQALEVIWIDLRQDAVAIAGEAVGQKPAIRDSIQAVAEIKAQSGYDYSADWERQGQTQYWLDGEVSQPSFIDDMWSAYHW